MNTKIVIAGGIILSVCLWSYAQRPARTASRPILTATRNPYDPSLAGKNIKFYTSHVKHDPESAIGNAMLAGAYLRRGSETGDISDYKNAESAARTSISIRRKRNPAGFNRLAQALIAQHRFREALRAARDAESVEPGDISSLRVQADILFELGEYKQAESLSRRARPREEDPADLAQRSRFAQLRGDSDEAVALLRRAAQIVEKEVHIAAEDAAWVHARLGAALAFNGRVKEAEKQLDLALRLFPNDYRSMTLRSELAACKGEWEISKTWAARGVKIERSPELLGLLGDAHYNLGNKRVAERLYDEVLAALPKTGRIEHAHRHAHGRGRLHTHGHTESPGSHGHLHDRHMILFAADHNRRLDDAVALARQELKGRKDIYTYDALAWALYKSGRHVEAESAVQTALSRGTKDARLHYHAGMIALAMGNKVRAAFHLDTAIRINPFFDPIGRMEAPAALSALQGATRVSRLPGNSDN